MIDTGASHPHLNMGIDEAILLQADAPPTLRLYRWQPAGLSLGYFQEAAAFDAVPGDHVLVRRLTGGGAIYHGDEITFSLCLGTERLPATVADSYELIHAAVRSGLLDVGVPTQLPTAGATGTGKPRPDEPWCFAEPIAADLLSRSARKILGSAQRRVQRPAARTLHHASLVMRSPSVTPFCGAVAETCDPDEIRADLSAALVERLAEALRMRPRAGELADSELDRAKHLATTRYGGEAFTLRR